MPLPTLETGASEPLYNIGAVTRLTGISMATLRAWERRYDFPAAMRTAGGHRLYSERDILQIKWVKERIDEGLQTAQAISAMRHQATARIEIGVDANLAEEMPALQEIGQSSSTKSYADGQAELLYQSLKRQDIVRSDNILNETLAVLSPEEIILRMISPVLSKIGEGWEHGEVSISAEHFATNYLRQRLLLWMINSPAPVKTAPVLLACAPEEWHEGSLLVIGSLLRRRRWPVAYLGQSVPLPDLAAFTRELQPSLLVMVAMTESSAQALADWPRWMPDVLEQSEPILGFGGKIFVDHATWQQQIAGVYLGDTFEQGVNTIELILSGIHK